MTVFDQAIRFAAQRHAGAVRKSGGAPYILHPMEAAVIVGTLTDDVEILAAAVLHDTVEDTDTTLTEIEARFGPRVAALVSAETEDKLRHLTAAESWRTRKEAALSRVAESRDPAAKLLFLGDKLSNLRSIHRSWLQRGDRVWQDFNQKDPAQQAWYYREADALLAPLRDTEAGAEFHRLVETVFGAIN